MSRKTRKYNSFEEIDLDLKILKLEREIHVQKFQREFQSVKKNLQPTAILEEAVDGLSESSFIERIISIILRFTLKSFKE
ncbi:DUF6327 family protein [Fluviicola sp.]|jgi:hypothetical protein|uniref:DUF6327 family protein n=1 Tax=Fluviicola sp. TaxID=1917219 RepID=UPI0028336F98|nr:DUF6327 family protein [Fluviicola sp.]MDR0801447.1 DUF6327 family protein [Fluviicola sp.]